MTTARERGQRWRRKLERAKGKPRIGRPRGSKNVVSSLTLVRNLYVYLHEHGHSSASAGALVRREFGTEVTELMVTVWRDIGHLGPKRKPRYDLTAYRAVRRRTLVGKEKTK
jgi:hypothetical protein